MEIEEAENIVSKAKKMVIAGGYYTTQTGKEVDIDKARMILKLGSLSSILSEDLA
jgi:hypothetical protein